MNDKFLSFPFDFYFSFFFFTFFTYPFLFFLTISSTFHTKDFRGPDCTGRSRRLLINRAPPYNRDNRAYGITQLT